MSLSVAYESVQDASMRLSSSVVLYDGEPVYITEVAQVGDGDPKGDVFRVYACPLPFKGTEKRDQIRKFISSKKFDMAPFDMGFMNYNGLAYYCSRLPRKQQKQGLSQNTLSVIAAGYEGEVPNLRFNDLIQRQEFLDCIKGVYPTLPEATVKLATGARSVGIGRCFAIVADKDLPELVYLYHKKEKVGFIMEGRLKLSQAGRCLKEALNEIGVRC